TALTTPAVLLVPYDRRHVPRYHEWMSDPDIQEATASEPLTLEEEYENQESWRASHDKLTFILCQPLVADGPEPLASVNTGDFDSSDKMLGDINFFLYPDDEEDEGEAAIASQAAGTTSCIGEVDIMIAGQGDRGKGLGKAAVSALLHYIWTNLDEILGEYREAMGEGESRPMRLKLLMAKIKATNEGSIALFRRLGFEQEGEVNYFGEVKMVLKNFDGIARAIEGYKVLAYSRPVD
ncbi:hypothetical protein M406DRAFT_248242, partial [Cryphonectria parasitica EP155]